MYLLRTISFVDNFRITKNEFVVGIAIFLFIEIVHVS